MVRISNNIKGTLGCTIVTLIFLLGALQLPFGSLTAPGAGFIPLIVTVALLMVCIFGIAKEILLLRGEPVPESKPRAKNNLDGG